MSSLELNPELRSLIDARLEEIERILLRVPMSYSERRNILGEVEIHIYELLSRRSEPINHELVQAVLASLDPAEAYIPEELRGNLTDAPAPLPAAKPAGPRFSRLAIAGGIMFAAAMVSWLLLVFSGFGSHSQRRLLNYEQAQTVQIALILSLTTATLLGVIATIRILLSSGKVLGLPLAILAAMAFPIFFGNAFMFAASFSPGSFVPTLLSIAAILAVNFYVLRGSWRLLKSHQHRLVDFSRAVFTGWRTRLSGSM